AEIRHTHGAPESALRFGARTRGKAAVLIQRLSPARILSGFPRGLVDFACHTSHVLGAILSRQDAHSLR
ncbi:MAG: hypothetical protein ACPIOQ_58500, partial [Promethearchaeia archaeon]